MLLRKLIGEDVALTLTLAEGVGSVKVDPTQLDQVIMNLAINASDSMPDGGRLVLETDHVLLDEDYEKTHCDCVPGPHVMLAVSDTGSGMPPEIIERIFEPFFTTKDLGKGTGLGLSTVFGIVQQSRGCIHVYSEPGRGTCFKVYLPRVETPPSREALVSAAVSRSGHETILLVEDDDDVRQLAELALRTHGYTVLVANDGQRALAEVDAYQGPIDLILTDIVMPNLGGPDLVAQLRQRFPQLRALLMSGYTSDAVVRNGLLDANIAFIQKPFTPRRLTARLREVLDGAPGGMIGSPHVAG